jgi:RNA polymerase sigma-70 factor (ECF subfamily)
MFADTSASATLEDLPAEPQRAGFEREAMVHLDLLYRVALRLSGNAADAEDLVQDTMLTAYGAWHQYRPGTNARAWLLVILRRLFLNEYHRRSRRGETVDVDAVEPFLRFPGLQEEDPEARFFEQLVDDEVVRAIGELPTELREVVVLHDAEDLRYEDIARILDVPMGTVKSRLFRARRRLQTRLREYAASVGYGGGSNRR